MTSKLGKELLAEAESDPIGLGYIDLEKLLAEWGVTKPLPGKEIQGYRTRTHESVEGFLITYPVVQELAPEAVLYICSRLRDLERIL